MKKPLIASVVLASLVAAITWSVYPREEEVAEPPRREESLSELTRRLSLTNEHLAKANAALDYSLREIEEATAKARRR